MAKQLSFWSICTFCSGRLLRFPRSDQSSCAEPAAFGPQGSISAQGSDGKWYHVSGDFIAVGQWVSYCESGGMRLARVDTEEDFNAVVGFLGSWEKTSNQ